ncbi:sigma-E processing peptidase SpoIIGA [Symbiobacterium terraclitae]|uniref:sigma-E processing peptidase SpoIIGA n=1 Tax=Symbiobacterium terraclitae TaxID=557451 RepID=UPI0035B53424
MGEVTAVGQVLLFVINLAFDLALLWFAARVARVRPRTWRLWAAALLGAALAVLPVVLPTAWPGGGGDWLVSGAAVVSVSALLVLLVVWPGTWSQFAAVFAFFWTGLALAGGLLRLLEERRPDLFVSPPAILVATGVGVAVGGVQLLWQVHRERAEVDDALYELAVFFDDRRATLVGLLDSGNHLRTPVSGLPVVIVAADRMRAHLPPEVVRAAGGGLDVLDGLPPEWQVRCQLVPYAAVGRADGMLLVVRPDGLAVRPLGRGEWVPVRGHIGLAAHPLDPEGRYAALLPGEIAAAARRNQRRSRTGEKEEEWPDAHVR